MFNKIYNPYTQSFIDFPSKEGIMLLNNYMLGGANSGRNQMSRYNRGKQTKMAKQSSKVLRQHQKYLDKKSKINSLRNQVIKNKILDDYATKIKYVDTQPELMEIYTDALKYLPLKYKSDIRFTPKSSMNTSLVFILIYIILGIRFGYGEAGKNVDIFNRMHEDLIAFRDKFHEDIDIAQDPVRQEAARIAILEKDFAKHEREMIKDFNDLKAKKNSLGSKEYRKEKRKMIKKWHPDMKLSSDIKTDFKDCENCLNTLKQFHYKMSELYS